MRNTQSARLHPPIRLPSGDFNPDFFVDLGERAHRVATMHREARAAFEMTEAALAALLETIDGCEDRNVLMSRRAGLNPHDSIWKGKHGRIDYDLVVTALEERILELQEAL